MTVNRLLNLGIELTGKKVLADKAFGSEKIRDYLAGHGAIVCIPDKSNASGGLQHGESICREPKLENLRPVEKCKHILDRWLTMGRDLSIVRKGGPSI